MSARLALLPLIAATVLAGCARLAPPPAPDEIDPAVAQAVIAPLLSDPDLVSLDRRFAVMSDPGPLDGSLPPNDFAPAMIAAARAEAAALMRGARPGALAQGGDCTGCAGVLLANRVRVLGASCAAGLDESLEWSLRLPGDLPVYPKSHLREGVGRESGACPVRGASFTAPVAAGQVLAFYRAIAAKAGYALRGAGPQGFIGTKGTSHIAVLVRAQPGGLSHFDLLVAG